MFPDRANKPGNRIALPKELRDHIIFMAPDRAPTYRPPMSAQTVQLGLRVRSTPNVARAKSRTKPTSEGTKGAAMRATHASPNPHMAGSLRDLFQCPLR